MQLLCTVSEYTLQIRCVYQVQSVVAHERASNKASANLDQWHTHMGVTKKNKDLHFAFSSATTCVYRNSYANRCSGIIYTYISPMGLKNRNLESTRLVSFYFFVIESRQRQTVPKPTFCDGSKVGNHRHLFCASQKWIRLSA